MKWILSPNLLLFIFTFFPFVSVNAQPGFPLNAEKRAALITRWMDQNLNLTQKQFERVEELNLKFAKKNEALIKNYRESRLKLNRKLKRSNRKKERKLKKILNDEQWDLYLDGKKKLQNDLKAGKETLPEPLADHLTIHQNKIYARHSNTETYLNTLDIYTNTEFSNAPVVIYIHGGGWRMGDKRRTYKKIPAFVDSGYVFVSINYRLSPAVKHPAHVKDLASAIDWVYQKISKFGGNPDQIILMGHSAGANMAAQVATDHSHLKQKNVPVSVLKGVIALDGAGYDVTKIFNSGNKRIKRVYKKAFGTDPEVWKNASPVNHITPEKSIPPFLLVHAGHRQISAEAARDLSRHLKNAGVKVWIANYPNEDHSSINKKLGDPDFQLTKEVFKFMRTVISPKARPEILFKTHD